MVVGFITACAISAYHTHLNLYSNILMKPILKRLVNVYNIFTYTYIQALALSLHGQPSFKQNM
jgi:hypothetical protein